MIDEQEVIRGFLNRQYVKLKRVASVGSLLLLALNLAFTVYPYVSHRWVFSNVYIGISLLLVIIILLLVGLAHVYVVKMEMYRTESKADVIYNPYNVYALAPKEEMQISFFYLPLLEGLYSSVKDESVKADLKKVIDVVRIWKEKGFIPKDDFPDELKAWYLTNKERRL
jgi:hypothetical protein